MGKIAGYKNKRNSASRNGTRAPRPNPASESEDLQLAYDVGVAAGGYGATRLLSRIAYVQTKNRFPRAAEHVAVATSVLSAAGVYLGTKYWDRLAPRHEAATIGAALAAVRSLVTAYVPRFGWVFADVRDDQYRTVSGQGQSPAGVLPPTQGTASKPRRESSPTQAAPEDGGDGEDDISDVSGFAPGFGLGDDELDALLAEADVAG